MLMIVGFVLAFIAFFIATMMTFQGSLPAPVAAIISGLTEEEYEYFCKVKE